MGVITGISGGIMRDILCNDIPLVLRSELYASIALIVGILNMSTIWFNLTSFIWTVIILIVGFISRLIAIYKKVELPKINY